jgi:tRNA threonylcarbamoyladenosine biosynthesis protein TsaE
MTREFGKIIGTYLEVGHVLCITGRLGAGKTLLTQGIVEGSRGDAKGVRSPSYTLVNEYRGPVRIYHVDLYRIDSIEEISELGLSQIMGSNVGHEAGAVIVEWGDKLGELTPADRLDICMEVTGPETREILLQAKGGRHTSLLKGVIEDLAGE